MTNLFNSSCVSGLPVNATDEALTMFFENRRHSGGDQLEEIVQYPVEGRAVLTYPTPEGNIHYPMNT